VIIVSAVATRSDLDFAVATVVVGGMVSGLAFFIQALWLADVTDPLEKIYAIKSPLIVAPNDVLYFSAMAPLAVYLVIDRGRSILVRMTGVLYLAITFALAVYMQSRQAAGVFLLATFFYAALLRPFYGLVVVVAGLAGILGFDWILGKGLLKKLVYLFPRRYVWSAAWQMFLDQPLLGQGPGMFRIFYQEFLDKAGYALSQVEDRRPMNWAHSLYLEQLAERGVMGLIALMVTVTRPILTTIRRASKLDLLDKSLLAAMAALLLSGIAEASLLRLWVMVLIFVLLALFETANQDPQPGAGASRI
jgi:O-antigen ligase